MLRIDGGRRVLVVALAFALFGAARAWAGCDTAADMDALQKARDLATQNCPCDAAATLGSYIRCVRTVAFQEVAAGRLPLQCKTVMTKCAARSTCGRRSDQAVTCVRTNHLGKASCKVVGLPALCRPFAGGIGCTTTEDSCCDALAVGCTTTTTSTTTTIP
jgi:hypothetical protein